MTRGARKLFINKSILDNSHCFTGSLFTVQHFLGIRFLGFVYSHFNFNHLQPFPPFPQLWRGVEAAGCACSWRNALRLKVPPVVRWDSTMEPRHEDTTNPKKTSEIDSCFWIYISFLDLLTEFESQKIPENTKNQLKSINDPPKPQKLQKHHRAQLCLEVSSSWPVLKRTIITNHSSPMCIQWKPWITNLISLTYCYILISFWFSWGKKTPLRAIPMSLSFGLSGSGKISPHASSHTPTWDLKYTSFFNIGIALSPTARLCDSQKVRNQHLGAIKNTPKGF